MQVEYAADLAFRSTTTLGPLYDQLNRQSVLSVKAEQVARFLGRRITPHLAQEIGSRLSTRIEGICVKHSFDKSSTKMYDKSGIVRRIETTTNDVSFFKHHRKAEHRDSPLTRELAAVKKSIYSLIDLREILIGRPKAAQAGCPPRQPVAPRISGCSGTPRWESSGSVAIMLCARGRIPL